MLYKKSWLAYCSGLRVRMPLSSVFQAEVLGAASAASGLLETSIRIVGRVRKANERQKELIRVLDNHDLELKNIKTIIQIVEDEDALQTAAVAAELVKLREIEKKLVECLKTLDPGGKGPIRKLAHQLVHGSKDEKTLADIMDELAHAKSDLSVRIQVANVGLTRTVEDTIVANAAAIDRIDQLLVPVFGEGRGLKIAQLLKDRSPQGLSYYPISPEANINR
jgi:hypothetical protein